MMFRTHLMIGILVCLLFAPAVNNLFIFIFMVLICTFLPDLDMSQTYLGKYKLLRPLQWFVKHKSFFHSFTLAVVIALLFAFNLPVLALPFFLGYSAHLLADSLTPEGIRPFWPSKHEVKWKVKHGGRMESIIFYSLMLVDLLLFLRLFL